MNDDLNELLDTMIEGTVGDVKYQFNLDTDEQAIRLIKQSLERLQSA